VILSLLYRLNLNSQQATYSESPCLSTLKYSVTYDTFKWRNTLTALLFIMTKHHTAKLSYYRIIKVCKHDKFYDTPLNFGIQACTDVRHFALRYACQHYPDDNVIRLLQQSILVNEGLRGMY
jgi:hypothetical protein